jgi:hypothetical protein
MVKTDKIGGTLLAFSLNLSRPYFSGGSTKDDLHSASWGKSQILKFFFRGMG